MTLSEWNRANSSYPSVKTLTGIQGVTPETASKIRDVMRRLPARSAMAAIDDYLGTYGVEYIPQGHNAKSPAITYCNTGDSYGWTVLYVNGKYRVGSWADIVERGNYD